MNYATSKQLTAISQLQKRRRRKKEKKKKKQWEQSYGSIMRDLWSEKNKSTVYIPI